jgi:hypothetical protein
MNIENWASPLTDQTDAQHDGPIDDAVVYGRFLNFHPIIEFFGGNWCLIISIIEDLSR